MEMKMITVKKEPALKEKMKQTMTSCDLWILAIEKKACHISKFTRIIIYFSQNKINDKNNCYT